LRPRPIRGTTAMLKPKLRAILSIPSRSPFFGKRAAMSTYPGTKSTIKRPMGIRRNRLLKGVRVKSRTARASTTAARRSAGICSRFLSIISFPWVRFLLP